MENIDITQLPWWGVLLVVFISTGGLTSVIGFLKWAIGKKIEARKKNNVPNALQIIQGVYQTLDTLRTKTDAMRIVVLRLSNGGNIPNPSSPLYSSILFESTENGVIQLQDEWQNRLVDRSYIDLVLRILEKKYVVTKITEMKKSMLKDLFETHGIMSTVTYPLLKTEKNLFLLSLDFGYPIDWDAAKREAVDSSIESIKSSLKEI